MNIKYLPLLIILFSIKSIFADGEMPEWHMDKDGYLFYIPTLKSNLNEKEIATVNSLVGERYKKEIVENWRYVSERLCELSIFLYKIDLSWTERIQDGVIVSHHGAVRSPHYAYFKRPTYAYTNDFEKVKAASLKDLTKAASSGIMKSFFTGAICGACSYFLLKHLYAEELNMKKMLLCSVFPTMGALTTLVYKMLNRTNKFRSLQEKAYLLKRKNSKFKGCDNINDLYPVKGRIKKWIACSLLATLLGVGAFILESQLTMKN